MLYTNIIHRVDPEPVRLEALDFQWKCASELNIPTTNLLTWKCLRDDAAMAHVEKHSAQSPDEQGLHFHEFSCADFQKKYHTREIAFWLLPRSVRTAMIDEMMENFHKRFGKFPASVGCYILDAWTLQYINRHYPAVKVAITNCFEEGIKMYQGSYYTWNLFSDGGPWGPFWPCKDNAMIPAATQEEAIGIVAVPHLNRDMIMSLISRDDLFASHPLNLVRAKINNGADCPYMYRFYDQWMRQSAYNPVNYLSYFVSTPWIAKDNFLLGDSKDGRQLYNDSLVYLKKAEEAGKTKLVTMDEFAQVFKKSIRPGSATACDWKDVLTEGKRQITWVVNSHYRAAFDLNVGGALCDFRVYSGRLARNLGPDEGAQHLWNGNYPYVISAEHRGGVDKSGWTCRLDYDGHTAWLHKRRINGCLEKKPGKKGWKLTCEPVRLSLGSLEVSVQSVFNMDDSGQIRVERILTESSDPKAKIELTEVFTGTVATTEYPESLSGAKLWIKRTPEARRRTLDFNYLSRELVSEALSSCGVDLTPIRSRISLIHKGNSSAKGKVVEGYGFFPAFQLQLSKTLTIQKSSISCLSLEPLKGR